MTVKCSREAGKLRPRGGLAFYSPTLSSITHTPTMTSRGSQSAGQEQIKPVAEVVTEMLVCQVQYDKGAGSKKGLI